MNMTADAQQELNLILAAQAKDMQARKALVECHLPMICKLANRLCVQFPVRDELIQAGCVGLIDAIAHYRPAEQTKLLTYAVPWILGEMKRTLRTYAYALPTLSLDEAREDNEEWEERIPGPYSIDLSSLDLRLAIARLSRDEQTLVYLRFFRDKTQRETACLLNKSQSQVSKIEKRALDRLHDMLA